jgi:sugar phosphate isomerase/epimerase
MATIASCILGLSPQTRDGVPAHDASPEFWRDQLRGVADQGFDSVEINDAWLKPTLMSPGRRAELVGAAADVGLEIVALHIQRASPIAPGAGDANLAYGHASIDAAAEMGVRVYSTGLHQPFTAAQRAALWFWTADGPVDPVDDRGVWAEAVSRIRELGRHAAEVGLPLSLELYEDTYLGTADSAVRFVEEVGLENVGLNPDVGNLIRLHRPVEDWRELYAKTLPHANYWHLKNYQRDESADRDWAVAFPATMRDGIINYRDVIALARELGYDGIFTCEHYGGDSLGVCGENRRYLETLLA